MEAVVFYPNSDPHVHYLFQEGTSTIKIGPPYAIFPPYASFTYVSVGCYIMAIVLK